MKEIKDILRKNEQFIKNITTSFEGLCMIYSDSSKSAIIVSGQCKYILTDASRIAVKVVHPKI